MTDNWQILQEDGNVREHHEEEMISHEHTPWEDQVYDDFIKPVIDYLFYNCCSHMHTE